MVGVFIGWICCGFHCDYDGKLASFTRSNGKSCQIIEGRVGESLQKQRVILENYSGIKILFGF
jgi:hypothetical protein